MLVPWRVFEFVSLQFFPNKRSQPTKINDGIHGIYQIHTVDGSEIRQSPPVGYSPNLNW